MIVLDTHVLIWAGSDPGLLSPGALHAMTTETVGVSLITCWEIGMLARRGLLELDRPLVPWFESALRDLDAHLLPITVEIAAKGAELPYPEVSDPADRFIIATALQHQAPVVTKEDRIRRSGLVETIW